MKTLTSKIEPGNAAIQRGLEQLNARRLAAVVPAHSHYDHAMDSPMVAMRTDALLVGSESTLNVGRGLEMKEVRMRKLAPNESLRPGKLKLTFVASP